MISTNDCWLYAGGKSPKGYGHVTLHFIEDGKQKRKSVYAHRVMYESEVGLIPTDMEIDHLCNIPACINPAHLEVVTGRENLMRGNSFSSINARKTHCKRGHEFTPENTAIVTKGKYTMRNCIACRRILNRRKYLKSKSI